MRKKLFTLPLIILISSKLMGQTWEAVGLFDIGHVNVLYSDTDENILYVGGGFETFNGVTVNRILKYDGVSWTSMGSGMDRSVFGITKYRGEIYASGDFYLADGNYVNQIAKWNGTTWESVGSGFNTGNNSCMALEVYNDELYVVGGFNKNAGSPYDQIARWNGLRWDSVSTGLTGINLGGVSLKVYKNDLYVGGNFSHAGGVPAQSIAKWNGTSWSNVSTGTNGTVTSFIVLNDMLFVGGFFNHGCGDGCRTAGVCKWNGTMWIDVGMGMNLGGATRVLGIYNGSIVASGGFTTADGNPVDHLAMWNGANWVPFFAGGLNEFAKCFATYNNDFYAGGGFTIAGGDSVSHLVKISLCSVLSLTYNITDVTHPGVVTDGAVDVNTTGGQPPYLYSLDSIIFQNSNTFNGLDTGTYQVFVSDSKGCSAKGTFTITYDTTVNAQRINSENSIRVFPNPFSDELFIELEEETDINLKLIDVLGRVVLTSQYENTSTVKLDVTHIPQGVYYLEVLNNKGEKLHTTRVQIKAG